MNLDEPFYVAITAMLDVNNKQAAIDYCRAASDYVEQIRRDRFDKSAAIQADLLDSVLARAIELAIRDTDNYDSFVHILSKCNPEQYVYSLAIIVASIPIPRTQNSYRQILVAIENLFNHRINIELTSRTLFDVLLGMINIHDIAATYSTFARHDSGLLDRIMYKMFTL